MDWSGPIEEWDYRHDYAEYIKEFETCSEFILHCPVTLGQDLTEILHPYFVDIYLYLVAGEELDLADSFSDLCPRKVFGEVPGYDEAMRDLFSFTSIREAWNHPYFRHFCNGRYQLSIPEDSYESLERHLVDNRSMMLWFLSHYKCDIRKTPIPPRNYVSIVKKVYGSLLSLEVFSREPFNQTLLRPEMTEAVEEFKRKIYDSLTTGYTGRKKSYKRWTCNSEDVTSQLMEQPGTSTQGINYQTYDQPGTSTQGVIYQTYDQPGTSSQGIIYQTYDQPGTSSQGIATHMIDQPGTSSQGIASQMAPRSETSSPEIIEIIEHTRPIVPSSINSGNFSTPELVNEIDMYHCSVHYGSFQIQATSINEQNTHFACGYKSDVEIFELDLERQESGRFTGCTARLQQEETNEPNLTEYRTQTHLAPLRYTPIRTLRNHEDTVTGLAYAPSGLLMSCSDDGTARVYASNNRNIFGMPDYRNTATYQHSDSINDIAVSYCDYYFATAASDKTACLWNFNRAEPLETYVHPSPVTIAEFDPGPWPMFVVTYSERQIFVWSAKYRELIWTIQCRRSSVNTIKVSPDEKHIACGDQRGEIKIYDVETRRMCSETQAHRKPCHYLAYNSDGTLLASSGGDCRIKFWRVKPASCGSKNGCLKLMAEYHASTFYPFYLKFHGRDFLLSVNNAKD